MPSTFFRIATDQTVTHLPIDGVCGGPVPSTCWLIGGGPSLAKLPLAEIQSSPIPKMGINLSGVGLIRPTFWTAYDPSSRFLRSIYLDAGIMKFVPRRRGNDFIPGTNYKVCEAPNILFFERDVRRGFDNFLDGSNSKIVDWADTFVQAIDILYRLGFRRILLAGCEMRVRPSREQIERAAMLGVTYKPFGLLRDFVRDCEQAGLAASQLDLLEAGPHYHFDERKNIRTAVRTDQHYFRIVQALRLSRRSIAAAGLEIVSVTPQSRLNDVFAYRPIRKVLHEIESSIGTTSPATLRGCYQNIDSTVPSRYGPLEDVAPYRWTPTTTADVRHQEPATEDQAAWDDEWEVAIERRQPTPHKRPPVIDRLADALNLMNDQEVIICEEG
ncbi:MAG: hypothetical protein ACKVT0_06685 [Planctomycetaceae bacterium]